MSAMAQGLNISQPPRIGSGDETMTLLEGATFCLSNRYGDLQVGNSHGLFFRDARVLSRWELRIDGHPGELLSVESSEAFLARFIMRRPPQAGLADSALLVVRERLIADGLHETISLYNLNSESTVVLLELFAEADFADLFTVKEGRVPLGGVEMSVIDSELVLRDRTDEMRGLTITASGDPVVLPGLLSWRVVVPAGQCKNIVITAQPTWANHKVKSWSDHSGQYESGSPAHKIKQWRDTATKLETDNPMLTALLRQTERDLGALLIHDETGTGKGFVAAGAPWFMTLFGRDSLLTAWMALPLDVGLSVGTLQKLVSIQGQQIDPITEEEPGRIMHEIRRGPASTDVLGGSIYYGSVDATLLFVMLLGEAWRWGISETVAGSLLPAADAALNWAEHYGDRDNDGFIEYQRSTDRGLVNQGWKDSVDGINDALGHAADPPVALCEVQGYYYAALLARAELAEAFGEPTVAASLRDRARLLQAKFDEAFWLPEQKYYAVALDRHKQPVSALTSNVGHCLWTGIASDDHAVALIEQLADDQMNSGFGLRTLATTMGAFNPMSYHNGSVWPHDTAITIAGLLRYQHIPGALDLAISLTDGLLQAAEKFNGRLPELYCGFPRTQFQSPIPYPTSCSPQAWSSAAPLLVVRSFLGLQPDVPNRQVRVSPQIPASWGRVVLTDLRLGGATVDLEAHGETVEMHRLPQDWQLSTSTS